MLVLGGMLVLAPSTLDNISKFNSEHSWWSCKEKLLHLYSLWFAIAGPTEKCLGLELELLTLRPYYLRFSRLEGREIHNQKLKHLALLQLLQQHYECLFYIQKKIFCPFAIWPCSHHKSLDPDISIELASHHIKRVPIKLNIGFNYMCFFPYFSLQACICRHVHHQCSLHFLWIVHLRITQAMPSSKLSTFPPFNFELLGQVVPKG